MDVRRFALRLKANKKAGDVVQNCAILLRELKKKGEIIQGFAVTETGERLQYYWVEGSDGTVYDICFELAKLHNPNALSEFKFTLVKEMHEKFEHDDHNQKLFKLYLEEPATFWKSVPRLN